MPTGRLLQYLGRSPVFLLVDVISTSNFARYGFLMLMSRTLTALTLATSLLVYGNLLNGSRVVFHLPWIFKFPMPEVWRFFTPFWVTGPGLSILFDTYFRKLAVVFRITLCLHNPKCGRIQVP